MDLLLVDKLFWPLVEIQVSELLREQSYLRSELSFSEHLGDEYEYPHSYCGPYSNLEHGSRSSSPGWTSRCSAPGSLSHGPPSIPSTSAPHGKPVSQATSTTPQGKQVYRSSVLMTPSAPSRAPQREAFTETMPSSGVVDQHPISQTSEPTGATAASPSRGARSHLMEHPDYHSVLQEVSIHLYKALLHRKRLPEILKVPLIVNHLHYKSLSVAQRTPAIGLNTVNGCETSHLSKMIIQSTGLHRWSRMRFRPFLFAFS